MSDKTVLISFVISLKRFFLSVRVTQTPVAPWHSFNAMILAQLIKKIEHENKPSGKLIKFPVHCVRKQLMFYILLHP